MIKILFLAANPKDTASLRLGEEVSAIEQRLRLSALREQFVVQQEWAVRVTDLQGHLLRHQPHIVHFSAHGSKTGKTILENPIRRSKVVTSRALKDLFSTLKDNVRCVVLNSCYSEAQAKAIINAVECVVGMSRAIDDRSAIAFAASFYQGLGYGRSLKTAFDLGCGQINLEGLPDKDVPKLRVTPGVDAANLFLVGDGLTDPLLTGAMINPGREASTSISSPPRTTSVFIRYSRQDQEFATKLAEFLRASGIEVWIAPAGFGGAELPDDDIDMAFHEADRLLLVLSENSMNTESFKDEIRWARTAGIKEGKPKLIPIRLVDIATIRDWESFDAESGKNLGVEISKLHIPDFSNWKDRESFLAAFNPLVKDLRAEVSTGPAAPTPR